MKQTKTYEQPSVEILQVSNEGVLCSSANDVKRCNRCNEIVCSGDNYCRRCGNKL